MYVLWWNGFEKFSVPTRVGSNILLILACRCMVLRTAICQLYALIQYNAYLIVSRINYIRCTFNSTGNLKNIICRWLMTVHNNSVQINSISFHPFPNTDFEAVPGLWYDTHICFNMNYPYMMREIYTTIICRHNNLNH